MKEMKNDEILQMISRLKDEKAVASRCLKNLKRLDFGKTEQSEKSHRKSTFASTFNDVDPKLTTKGDASLKAIVKRTSSGKHKLIAGALIKTRLISDTETKIGKAYGSTNTNRDHKSSTRCGTDRPTNDQNIFIQPKPSMNAMVRRKVAKYRFEPLSNNPFMKSTNY